MSWSCPICQKDFSRKDSMQRHMSSKHSTSGFPPFQAMSISREKCQRFHLGHPFTCMVAGMTGSGKTLWVKSLLQQAHKTIHLPPERIVWCYSQWQPAYSELLMTIPGIEFSKGIPETLEQDSYFDVNIRNLIVIDDQMIEAGSDNRVVNLFTKGSHHRNLSVIYIVQNLFHQGKGTRSISLNSHYLVLFKNPRDKLQILTLAKQMYPGQTAWFMKQYEDAVQRPFGYLFVDLKPTTQESCRLRTNVLPGEERFDKGEVEGNVSKELVQYLKQQNLMTPPVISKLQRLQNNMDSFLSRRDLAEDEKARQYIQLQNRFLTYKHQLNSIPEATQEQKQISTAGNLPTVPTPLQESPVTIPAAPVQTPNQQVITSMATSTPLPPSPPPSILTPPPTVHVESLSPPKKRKRPQIRFVNYWDDEPKRPSRRSRRIHKNSPYKSYEGQEENY
ncbi:hypothetical protein ACROYT_G003026 [Oculina patagonica]